MGQATATDRQMRIAMLSWESLHSTPGRGLSAQVTELSSALQRQGHDVHVFTRKGADQTAYACIDAVHYHRCAFQPHADFLTYVTRMGDAWVERLRAAEDFYGRPFDVVHGHDWLCANALMKVRQDFERPVVLTLHSTESGRGGDPLYDPESRAIQDLEFRGTQAAHRVISVSAALADEIQRLYDTPAEKLTVVYNGVDVHRFDTALDANAIRKRFEIGEHDPLILFVGRLRWQKGPDLLLEAMPGVLKDYPVALAGDGYMRSSLEARAASMGVLDCVRFVGHRSGEDLVAVFKSADAVCVPSRSAPFGIVVLESWSACRPVIVTRNGGPAEVVRHEETGFAVAADGESLRGGLETALADRERSLRIGQNGRREAETRFNWDVIARDTARTYMGTLNE